MPPAVAMGAAVLGSAVAGSAAVVAVVGTVGAAIVGGVVATGINILGNKLLGTDKINRQGASKDPGVMVNVQDNVASIPIIYGRRRIAGRQVYVATSGQNNKYLHIVHAIAEGEIQEIERIVFGDNEIVFDGSVTPMTTASGTLAASQARGRFKNFVSLEWRLGTTTQTAFSDLVASTAAQEGNWTTDHRGLGIAMVHIKILYDKEKMNQVPTVTFDIKGKKCRTFAGTYVYSDNPADALLDYLTNETYGKGLSINDIDQPSYTEVYNYCNEIITLYTDASAVTGKRYLCNGYLNPDVPVFDNIKDILSSCNGYLLWGAGKYKFKVLKEEANTGFTFDESNIIGAINMELGSKEVLCNRVKAHFYNSGLDFAEDLAIYEDADLKDREDNGEWLEREISLPFVSDYTRALMLAKQTLQQSRRATTISFIAAPNALEVEVGDHVWFSHPYLGFQDNYRVMGMVLNPDKTVSVTLVQYDDEIYSLADIAVLPGQTGQARNIRINGVFDIKPDAPTNITWYRFCPGAVNSVDNGYAIHVTAPTTGKKNDVTATFISGNVNTTAETISITAHALSTGNAVVYNNGGGSSVGGLTSGNTYYVIRVDADIIKLALTLADAQAGTNINFTTAGSGSNHSLFYQGETVAFDNISYYRYTAVGDTTKSFTASTTTLVVPEGVWPTGTITSISVQAIATDGTQGAIGTTNTGYVLNPDATTLCPPLPPLNVQTWILCDGTAGVRARNGIGGPSVGGQGGADNRQAKLCGPGTAKVRVEWTHSADVAQIVSYDIAVSYGHSVLGEYYTTTQTVAKAGGAVAGGTQALTLTDLITLPTFVAGSQIISVAVQADTGTVTSMSDAGQLIINPDANTDCWLRFPDSLAIYQICNGAGGTSSAGTASPAYTGLLDTFGANVTSKIGWKIKHGPDFADTVDYEVAFTLIEDGVTTHDFIETVTRSASATYNAGGANDYQYFEGVNTVVWPDPSTFTSLVVIASVQGKNATATTAYTNFTSDILNPNTGERCL